MPLSNARGQRPVDALAEVDVVSASDQTQGQTSLPAQTGLFMGRETELAEIVDLLSKPDCRLLSLVGPGGIGKTSLALACAHHLAETFADGVVFVPLAPVEDAAMISPTIAQSLNLALSGSPEEQLIAYLRQQNLLLVLDNCEQLGDGVAWFSTLLAVVPGLTLLVTSREALQLAEEWLYRVPPLAQPQAVDLFAQVARRKAMSFQLGRQESEVSQICQLVGNLPLALELAAGWTPMMPCAQIAEHIQQDIDFLAANQRDLPERHRSVRAVFDHSWSLLSETEQNALMRLSVFRGGWTTEAAETVAGATLPVLRALMDKSLLRAAGDGRFDMHELIRQYAEMKLHESGVDEETHLRHMDACQAMILQLVSQLNGRSSSEIFSRFEQEMDNFRAALGWCLNTNRWELALQLLDSSFYPLLRRGYWQEGEHWHKAAQTIAPDEDNYWLCQSLLACATYTALQGRFADAAVDSQRGSAMAYRLEDPIALMRVHELNMQADPDLDSAREHFEQARELMENWDHPAQAGRYIGLHWLFGDRLFHAGQMEEATALFEFSLEELRKSGDVEAIAYPMGNLGRVALDEGRLQEAYELISESVRISREAGVRVGIADWLLQLGKVLLEMQELEEAATAFDEALALYEEVGNFRAIVELNACLGRVALAEGNITQAVAYLETSLRGYRRYVTQNVVPHPEWGTPLPADMIHACGLAAQLAAAQGQETRAVIILAKTEALRPQIKFGHQEPALLAQAERLRQDLLERFGASDFEAAWADGEAIADEAALLTFALGE